MMRIGEIVPDEAVIGDRGLSVETPVTAYRCLWVDDGWVPVERFVGRIAAKADRTEYGDSENGYKGATERVMPATPWSSTGYFPIGHPLTLEVDPHDAEIDDQKVVERWVVQRGHRIHLGNQTDV